MKSTELTIVVAAVVAASGCSHEKMGLAPLDQPAVVIASGAQPQSQVTIYRQGAMDPADSLTVVQVSNAFVRVTSDASHAHIDYLLFLLKDIDLAPTTAMPKGLRLRNQQLELDGGLAAELPQHEPNALTAQAHGSMTYRASMVADDGSLRPIGPVATKAADFDVRATRYEFGVRVTVDAAPQGSCWSVPGVLDVSNCSLYVETDGDSTSAQ
jgi:hypothetical protein